MIRQRITLLLTIICALCTISQAQDKKRPGFSKEEFRARQEAYLTEKAELTREEAARFFPLYFELQDRKKKLTDESWEQARKGKNPDTTEEEYSRIIEIVVEARIEADRLDLEYLQKYKEILSSKKIYRLQRAETKFHRDLLKIMHQQPPRK